MNCSVLQGHHKLTEQTTMHHHTQHLERSHDHYSRSQHDLSYRDSPHKGAASRPTTLALGTPPDSPGPHRGQVLQEMPTTTHPQKTKASSSPTKSYQPVNRHLPMEKPQADTNIGCSTDRVCIMAVVRTNHYTCMWTQGPREEQRKHRHPCRTLPHITAPSN